MKAPELRRFKKILKFYELNFGIRAPFKIILDGNFVHQALHFNLDFSKQLGRAFIGEEVIALSTPQIIQELNALGEEYTKDVELCKTFRILDPISGRRISKFTLPSPSAAKDTNQTQQSKKKKKKKKKKKSSSTTQAPPTTNASGMSSSSMTDATEETITPAAQSILQLIGEKNASRYCVATQNETLRKELRRRGGVPILFLMSNRMLWEGPSSQSENVSKVKLSVEFGLPLPKGVPLPKVIRKNTTNSTTEMDPQQPQTDKTTQSMPPTSRSQSVIVKTKSPSSNLISPDDLKFLQELGMDDLVTPQDLHKTNNNKRKKKWFKPAQTSTPKRRKISQN